MNALIRPLHRLGRQITWGHPALYLPVGLMRGRGNVFRKDYEVWLAGYPRSGNTYSQKAFQLSNPERQVLTHRHLPTYVIQSLRQEKPGVLLIRQPRDAAISWSIYDRDPLRDSLEYYIDFHKILVPYRNDLSIVRFENVVQDFNIIIEQMNARWDLGLRRFSNGREDVDLCISQIENDYRDVSGDINELRVCRPSEQRASAKNQLLRELQTNSKLQSLLQKANDLFEEFTQQANPVLVTNPLEQVG